LSARGREEAAELGRRRGQDGLAAVFCSDLARATQTASIAFDGTRVPVLADWRLRECNFGELNGSPADLVHADRAEYLDQPYPGGESWWQAVARVGRFLGDLAWRWDGRQVLLIGHIATHWALEHMLADQSMEVLAKAEFPWQPGWEYTFNSRAVQP
jgi:broad specificity phosphatase PhoE